jgi:hypothetical protein
MNANDIADILRRVTLYVKLSPFVYTGLYLLCMIVYPFAGDNALIWLDMTLYVSPVMIAVFVMLSYALRMCVWHRLQCSLPLISYAVSLTDSFIYEFGEIGFYVNIATAAVISVLSIINGIKIFTRQ